MSFDRLPISDFCARLASADPTPGGGTAAAAAGALGAALVEMVCALTLGKEKFQAVHAELRPVAEEASRAGADFRALMQQDTDAFDAMMAARRLPRDTDEQKTARAAAIEASARHAAEVPMKTARTAATLLSRTPLLAEKGNPNAASDAGVAALLLAAAAEGALFNVGINLPGLADAGFVEAMEKETALLSQEIERDRAQTIALVRRSFSG